MRKIQFFIGDAKVTVWQLQPKNLRYFFHAGPPFFEISFLAASKDGIFLTACEL
jgi:hypothetical protein